MLSGILKYKDEVEMTPEAYSQMLDDEDQNFGKCERIKMVIDSFLQKNPNLSLQNIENKTGLPISTLRRIINLNGNPNPENVIKLYLALGFDQELEKYLEKYHPTIAALMFEKNRKREHQYVEKNEAQYFVEESSFLIMNLAHTSSGTTEESIRFEMGERGLAKMFELLDKGILKRRDDGKIIGNNLNWKLSYKDTLTCIGLSLKHYRINEAGSINNFLNYQTESLSLEGLNILRALEKDQANERRERVFNNPSLQGDFPIFTATVSSTFVAYSSNVEVLQ